MFEEPILQHACTIICVCVYREDSYECYACYIYISLRQCVLLLPLILTTLVKFAKYDNSNNINSNKIIIIIMTVIE